MTRQCSPRVEIRVLHGYVLLLAVLAVFVLLAASAIAQNPVPFVDQPLVPDATAPGGPGFTLTVNGAGFVAGSVVNWNGSPRATTFVSGSKLTAAILASDIAKASTASVTVVSPSPGGGVSNEQYFSIAAAETAVSFLRAVSLDSGGLYPNAVAVADLNGDGKLDLVVASCESVGSTSCGNNGFANGALTVLLGNGDGTFATPVPYDSGGANAASVTVADVNGDGKLDLIVANYGISGSQGYGSPTGGAVSVLLGNGDGTFLTAVAYASGGISAQSVAVADLNGDGKLDIIVANDFNTYNNSTSGTVGVLLGKGDGAFEKVVTYLSGEVGATGVAIADVNGDGRLDLVVSNGDCPNTNDAHCAGVLLGNGDGTFQPVITYKTGGGEVTSVAVADVNGDGTPDLLVTNWCVFCANTVGVLLGNGDGSFQGPATYGSGGYYAWSIAVADVNTDGKPDLLVANQCTGSVISCTNSKGAVSVLLNNGNGTFKPAVSYYSGGEFARFLVSADVNGDGKPDLLVVNEGTKETNGVGSVGVMINDTGGLTATTSTSIMSSLNPSLVGQSVTFRATVGSSVGAPPNGEIITFKNGSAVLGSGTLSGGTTSLTTSAQAAGIYTITASYGGDANFAGSTSSGLRQVVNSTTKAATSTGLVSSLNPSIYGQKVEFTATVTTTGSVPPTGKVSFVWEGYSIGSATLNASGVASLSKSNLNVYTYPVTAVYSGDANNLGSTSAIVNQVVKEATSAAVLSASPNPSTQGQSVTFTATITSPTVTPTGPVTFTSGTTVLGTAELSAHKATFTTSTLPAGTTAVKATYAGNSNIAGSSASVTETVQP